MGCGSATACSPSCGPRGTLPSVIYELSEEQVRLLERFSPEFRERRIEAPHTGVLVVVDRFFVGTLKGVESGSYCQSGKVDEF